MVLYISFFLSLWSSLLAIMSMSTQLLYRAGRLALQKQSIAVPPEALPPVNTIAIAILCAALFFTPVVVSLALARIRIKQVGRAERLIIVSLALNGFSIIYGIFAVLVFVFA